MENTMTLSDLLTFIRTLGAPKKRGAPPSSSAALEAALADARREREAARTELSDMGSLRNAALLEADDARINELEARERAANLALERLDLVEERLIAELSSRRDADRLAQGEALAGELVEAIQNFMVPARALLPLAAAVQAAHDRLIAAGFREAEAAERLPVMGHAVVIAPDLLARYEASSLGFLDTFLASLRAAGGKKPAPLVYPEPLFQTRGALGGIPPEVAKAIEHAAVQPKAQTSVQRTPKTDPIPAPAPAPRPLYGSAAELPRGEDGLVAVEVFRGRRVETVAGEVLRAGMHRISPEAAFAALRTGSADLFDEEMKNV
jgi:hypothetical protein